VNDLIKKLFLQSRYEIHYVDEYGHASQRIINPVKKFSENGQDYIRALCEACNELRTFRMDRLKPPVTDLSTGEIIWSRSSMAQVLQKGANANLSKLVPQLDDLLVTLQWAFPEKDDTQIDMDVSGFLLTAESKVRGDKDIVFYNQPATKEGSLELLERSNPSRQCFKLNLTKIPKTIEKIAFTLTLYEPDKTAFQLNQLQALCVQISNGDNTVDYVTYPLESCDEEAALILVEIYRYQGDWKIRAINQGFVGGLAALATHYGVKVKEKPAPKPSKKKVVSYNTERFIVFDLETTGLDAYRNEIIEIGALKYCNGQYTELQCLVKPTQKIPPFITNLTGITQEMVDDNGIHEFQALAKFIEFIEDYPLVAYNAPFDRRFIAAAGKRYNVSVANPFQCAMQMARKAWKDLDNHKLLTVIQALNLAESQQHRALEDCYLTASIYLKATTILTATD
jgi:DNA polymerase III epsilon subunit family exonuclease